MTTISQLRVDERRPRSAPDRRVAEERDVVGQADEIELLGIARRWTATAPPVDDRIDQHRDDGVIAGTMNKHRPAMYPLRLNARRS